MYLKLDKKQPSSLATIDSNGDKITYGELCAYALRFEQILQKRTIVFCLCENKVGALVGYTSFIENRVVPLLLPSSMERKLLAELMDIYKPKYLWCPSSVSDELTGKKVIELFGYTLIETENELYPINEELSLLLTTSGSTGSPKLVRHCYKNIEANARNVAAFFEITTEDRPLADLPMHYTMGLNVICSHLYGGATVLLTAHSIMSKEYWQFFTQEKCTAFTGVPYSYEVLQKLRFTRSEWPHLRILTQGGGKLPESTYVEFAEYAKRTGKSFIPTFGQTECTARMAFLPPELALEKVGAIGDAIPEGELFLIDDDKSEIVGNDKEGEMGYRGPNVTMGYALCRDDLTKGDEWHGETHTGDMAKRDKDGIYFIIGRKKRFLKLFGYRVSLDQCERLIQGEYKTECACTGTDKKMIIYVSNEALLPTIPSFLSEKTGIIHTSFQARYIDKIPRNEAGKITYSVLENI